MSNAVFLSVPFIIIQVPLIYIIKILWVKGQHQFMPHFLGHEANQSLWFHYGFPKLVQIKNQNCENNNMNLAKTSFSNNSPKLFEMTAAL